MQARAKCDFDRRFEVGGRTNDRRHQHKAVAALCFGPLHGGFHASKGTGIAALQAGERFQARFRVGQGAAGLGLRFVGAGAFGAGLVERGAGLLGGAGGGLLGLFGCVELRLRSLKRGAAFSQGALGSV